MEINDTLRQLVDNQMISTGILIAIILLCRFASNRYLQCHLAADAERRRRIASNIRNALFVLTLFGLLFIWAPSLRSFALSLTAFAVAIILATKELILCLSGTFFKTSTGDFRIGDWITVNGVHGEVVDQTFMSTKLQELGEGGSRYEFTGRTVTLPNSVFLSAHVINDEMTKQFVYHTIAIAIDRAVDPAPIIDAMTRAIAREAETDKASGQKLKSQVEKTAGILLPESEPVVHFVTSGEGKLKLLIRAMVSTKRATAIEKAAILAGLEAIRKTATEQSAKTSDD